MNLVCLFVGQGAYGSGGQDWVGPHRQVGRLVVDHTARRVLVGGSRQVIIRTASVDASAGNGRMRSRTRPPISPVMGGLVCVRGRCCHGQAQPIRV
jgi:hypothetical protein